MPAFIDVPIAIIYQPFTAFLRDERAILYFSLEKIFCLLSSLVTVSVPRSTRAVTHGGRISLMMPFHTFQCDSRCAASLSKPYGRRRLLSLDSAKRDEISMFHFFISRPPNVSLRQMSDTVQVLISRASSSSRFISDDTA
jgi:hypothetical protein